MSTTYPISAPTAALAVLAGEINAAHRDARQHAARAIERALEAGDLLLKVKATLAHGQWLPWLAEHCPDIAPRTAQGYMRLSRELPAEMRSAAHLTQRGAIRLLSPPQDAPDSATQDAPDSATQDAPDPSAALLHWLDSAPLFDGLYPANVYLMDAAGWPLERMLEVLTANAARYGRTHSPGAGEVRALLSPDPPERVTCCVRHHLDPKVAYPEGATAEDLYRVTVRYHLTNFQQRESQTAALYAHALGLGELAANLEGAARAYAPKTKPRPAENLIEQAAKVAAYVDHFHVVSDTTPEDGWHLPVGMWAAVALHAATEESGLLWDACRALYALTVTPEAVKGLSLYKAAEVYLHVALFGAELGNMAPREMQL